MRQTKWVSAALGLLVCVATSCSTKRDTAIVLWLETDFAPLDIAGVRVQIRTQDSAGGTVYDRQFPRVAQGQTTLPWSGSLVIAPNTATAPSRVHVSVTVTPTASHGTAFTVEADAPFARNEWRQMEVFLARQCAVESVRSRCATVPASGEPLTCGSADSDSPCIPIRRENLTAFSQDAGLPDVVVGTFDVPSAQGADAAFDAREDSTPDASVDVLSDSPTQRSFVQLLSPPYAARVSGGRPFFSAYLSPNAQSATLELCPSINCMSPFSSALPITNHVASGIYGSQIPLSHVYWRVVARDANNVALPTPEWRPLFVGAAMPLSGGRAHPITGIVADLDNDGIADPVYSLAGGARHAVSADYSKIGIIWPARSPLAAELTVAGGRTVGSGNGAVSLAALGNARNTNEFSVFMGDPSNNMVYRFEFGAIRAQAMNDVLTAPARVFGFGAALAPGGDINGDGFSDLVVGSSGNVALMGMTAGAIVVYFGGNTSAPNGLSANPLVIQAPAELDIGSRFGSAVSSVCDYNNDGYADIVVGAGNASVRSSASSRVYLYFGGPTLNPNSAPAQILMPNVPNDFGNSVACAGDMDGDGNPELLVGATAGDGQFHIYYGNGRGVEFPARTVVLGLASSNEQLGRSVAGGGDLDGDGLDDAVIGAPTAGQYGLVKVFFGNAAQANAYPNDAMEVGSFYGYAVAMLGRRTLNSQRDSLFIGAPLTGPSSHGAVYAGRTDRGQSSVVPDDTRLGVVSLQAAGTAVVRMN